MDLKNLELDKPPTWMHQVSRYLVLRPWSARGLLDMPVGIRMIVSQTKLTIKGEYMTPPR